MSLLVGVNMETWIVGFAMLGLGFCSGIYRMKRIYEPTVKFQGEVIEKQGRVVQDQTKLIYKLLSERGGHGVQPWLFARATRRS